MSPSEEVIWVARITWRDAKTNNTPTAWLRCAENFSAMAFLARGTLNRANYEYLDDMHYEALYMLEDQ